VPNDLKGYLDYASTTPLDTEIRQTYEGLLKAYFANSDSLYKDGRQIETMQEESRQQILKLLGLPKHQVIFTSGASEANNLALKGTAFLHQIKPGRILVSAIEHSSVLNSAKQLAEVFGFEVVYLPVDEYGIVKLEALKKNLTADTILVSIQYVNNETGTLEPIREILSLLREYPGVLLHCDCVQALGKIDLSEVKDADLISLSAHKIYGLKGSGVLLKKKHLSLVPLISAGQQEEGLRGGTSNALVNIVFAKTLRLALEKQAEHFEYVTSLNQKLRKGLKDEVIFLSPDNASPYILSIANLKLSSEVWMNALEKAGFLVSAKSTCSSRKTSDSHVLVAMGIKPKLRQNVIRVSLSHLVEPADIDRFIAVNKEILAHYGL